jgi:hypothetical protein
MHDCDGMTVKLTDNEQKSLEVFQAGMDRENCGWLGELESKLPVEGKAISGIISSLVKKGVITCEDASDWYDDTTADIFYVEVQEPFRVEESN